MKILPQPDDAPEFVEQVACAMNSVLRRYSPASLVLIKIDNWFGKRWLGFSGKFIGIAGVTFKVHSHPTNHISIPPFVPERVVLQRRFTAPDYEEVDAGESVQKQMPSKDALRREAALAFPETALAWYSGNSKANGRGALMVYLPINASFWCWYVGLENATTWRVTECWGIKHEEYAGLIEEGLTLEVSPK
jgi:hypothetical protein